MATTQQKATPKATGDASDFAETLKQSYKVGMNFSERIGATMLSLPLDFAEMLGLSSDKTQGLRDLNDKMVGGLYRGIDGAIDKVAGAVMAPAAMLEAGLSKAMAERTRAEAPVKTVSKAAKRKKTVARKKSSVKKQVKQQARAAEKALTEEIAA